MAKNSHQILFTEIKERLRDQFQSIDSLDNKAGLTLGFVGALFAGLINSDWFLNLPHVYLLPILALLILATLSLLVVILVRQYRKDPEPTSLIKGYENATEEKTVAQLIRNFEECYNKNEPQLKNKRIFINLGFVLLFLTLAFLAVALINNDKFITGKNMDLRMHRWEVFKNGKYR